MLGIDARSRADAKGTLIALVLHALRGSTPSSSQDGGVLPVVILHWNRPERCVGTVARFLAQDVPGGVRVVVVDNGSEPDARRHRAQGPARRRRRCSSCRATAGSGPGANVGFRHVLANPEPGDVGWIGLAPHDAEPAPGCLARMLEVVGERPRAGLACADFGDGATPIVDPYFGGILAPGHRRPRGGSRPATRTARCCSPAGSCSRRSACSTSATSPTARRPTSPCGPAAAGWETGLIRGAIVVNPDLGTRVSVIDYLQLRNTLLLVREHSGRYHATIRGLLAVGQLARGPRVAGPPRARTGTRGRGCRRSSTTPAAATARRRSSIQDR